MDQLPASFSMADMTAGKTHPAIIELIEGAMRRFPAITRDTPIDIRGGVMAFTPDGQPLLGRMPGVEGLFHCAGFCGHGVSQSAGIGRLMADLVLTGVSSYDLKQLEADRFADIPAYRDRAQVTARCLEQYANYYEIAARGSTMRPGRD
jgi:glycine/D-amino acid oxidase-like deaminating enzyme